MIITRRSPFTGVENQMDIPITQEELVRLEGGELIQAVIPHLSIDQREFLITGITPTEWDVFLGPGDDDPGLEEDDGVPPSES
jgi:hypothetical protein